MRRDWSPQFAVCRRCGSWLALTFLNHGSLYDPARAMFPFSSCLPCAMWSDLPRDNAVELHSLHVDVFPGVCRVVVQKPVSAFCLAAHEMISPQHRQTWLISAFQKEIDASKVGKSPWFLFLLCCTRGREQFQKVMCCASPKAVNDKT